MVQVTEEAAVQIKRMLSESGKSGYGLRFGLKGGGCSGYTYHFDFEPAPAEGDVVHEAHGVRVFVKPTDLEHVDGSTILWRDNLMETGIHVENPNVKRACGCGVSVEF